MGKIKTLDPRMRDLIAAGEVIDRPASAVKELMENSIDAGARFITVEIKGGGAAYLRVTDDGCGMDGQDLLAAFQSHATSKISAEDDLWNITTLGFRGEALPSIAAAGKAEARSRTAESDAGAVLRVEGGVVTEQAAAGCPVGLDIAVRELFYNTPGRQKFLKKDATEAAAVAETVDRIALARPDVAVRFVRDGREVFATPGDGDPQSAIYAVMGREAAAAMLPVRYELGGVTVTGCISRPERSRANRAQQYFFVNRRFVRSKGLSFTLENACKSLVPQGRHALCVLYIELNPRLIDVNVHPQKLEVKFADERRVAEALHFAIKSAITGVSAQDINPPKPILEEIGTPEAVAPAMGITLTAREYSVPALAGFTPVTPAEARADIEAAPSGVGAPPAQPALSGYAANVRLSPGGVAFTDAPRQEPQMQSSRALGYGGVQFAPLRQPEPEQPPEQLSIPDAAKSCYRLAGECYATYAVVETPDALIFIDKHAARERIIYERLKAAQGARDSQSLLDAAVVRLTREERAVVLSAAALLEQAGFIVEDFGGDAVVVRGVPMDAAMLSPEDLLTGVAGALAEGKRDAQPELYDRLLYSIACKAAIKAGANSPEGDLRHLIDELMNMPEVRYCPHGRPVSFTMPKRELDKRFLR